MIDLLHTDTSQKMRKKALGGQQRGFTLIELLAYMAIFITVSVVAIFSLLSSMQDFSELQSKQAVLSSARISLQRIAFETRRAESVDIDDSILRNDHGKLVLNTTNASGDQEKVTFSLSDGVLYISEDGGDPGALTEDGTYVRQLRFSPIETNHSPGLKIVVNVASPSQGDNINETFYDTLILRNE